jgi:hypothetical protein
MRIQSSTSSYENIMAWNHVEVASDLHESVEWTYIGITIVLWISATIWIMRSYIHRTTRHTRMKSNPQLIWQPSPWDSYQ